MRLPKTDARKNATSCTGAPTVGNIGEDNEESMAVGFQLAEHPEEDLREIGVDGSEMSLALVNRERREPFQNR